MTTASTVRSNTPSPGNRATPIPHADCGNESIRKPVDQVPWVPLVNPKTFDFLSKRVGNYQYNPSLGILIDQLWVH